jgi:malate dehydrogenase (oxaloacetate-decarboxylating)
MEIPVWHDDQQGTATVTLAALINALKLVGKKLGDVMVSMIGAGAANIAISRILFAAGARPEKYIIVDSKGILHPGRKDLQQKQEQYIDKWKLCQTTNAERRTGGTAAALRGVDVCIALSQSGPGVIRPDWIKGMAKDAIVFACANPIPEIWPWEAKEAGAKIVATGRSDFPNQVNNSLGVPGIFRGALDVRARTITDEMCIAAAHALAQSAEKRGLSEDNIAPTMWEAEAYVSEAVATGMKAQEQGVARISRSAEELRQSAETAIRRAQELTAFLMKEGFIAPAPQE